MKRWTVFIVAIMMVSSFSQAYEIKEWERNITYKSITIVAPAVAEGKNGYYGVTTKINVTMMNGSGNVYFAASPLTQIDMQGSAKLAVDVACALAGVDRNKYDFLFYVKSDSPIVGGPSAGATMTVATLALIEGINLNDSVAMTGMINPDGSIGPVGGILEKGEAIAQAGKKIFLIPKGQMIEYITNYTRQGIWIIGKQEAINVSQVLYKKYGLIVKEVEDINEAFYYFTGYKFPKKKSSKPITTSDYRSIMRPLARNVIEEANLSYRKAMAEYNDTNIPVGSWLFSPRGQIENKLDDARDDLMKAYTACRNGFFYYGISKAFQSMISSRFVRYACMFYRNGSNAYSTIYSDVSRNVNASYDFAKSIEISDLISLQCVGAAQERAMDAKDFLNKSKNEWKTFVKYKDTIYRDESKALQSLYDIAYAMERVKTIYWWINLSKNFNGVHSINESVVMSIAQKYYDYAKQIYAYAKTLVEETGSNGNYIKNAEELLGKAENEMNIFPASSLFSSLESIANSNIAIEAIGGLTDEKMNRTRQMAGYAIIRARNESIEPILAVSYYEFGNSISNKADAIIYFKYSYMIANTLRLSKGIKESKPEYIGNNISGGNQENRQNNNHTPGFDIIWLIISISILVSYSRKRRNKI